MKFVDARPYSNPETAARKLISPWHALCLAIGAGIAEARLRQAPPGWCIQSPAAYGTVWLSLLGSS
jgi:hypothetical protein